MSSWLDALTDIEELNNLLNADPALRDNMREMGFIKAVGFHKDHNNQLTTKWEFTEHGRNEMLSRLNIGLDFAMTQDKARKQ